MKSLDERLADYKLVKQAILDGETNTGYSVRSKSDIWVVISFEYTQLEDKLIIQGWASGGKVLVKLFNVGEEKEAKEFCYKHTFRYLRKINWVPKEVKIVGGYSILAFSERFFGYETTSFGKLTKKQQERVNKERARRGFGAVQTKRKVS